MNQPVKDVPRPGDAGKLWLDVGEFGRDVGCVFGEG